jgi:hypothetical protein
MHMYSSSNEAEANQIELNTRAFIGAEENSQQMNVFVEIELNPKQGAPFKIVVTPSMAINMAMRILATAYMTVADAFMLESMHKMQVEPSLITRIVNMVRMKRSAGQG